MSGEQATPRAVPFLCPYCGEPDIRPDDDGAGWHCRVCDRRFELTYLGLGRGGDDGEIAG